MAEKISYVRCKEIKGAVVWCLSRGLAGWALAAWRPRKFGRKDVGSGAREMIRRGVPVPPFTSCGVSGSLLNHPMFPCHFLENKRRNSYQEG